MTVTAIGEELGDFGRAFRALAGADVLIVPGTGLITDAYGLGAWGPSNLFKWTLAAKVKRMRVLYLSVGAGPIYGTVGKLLIKASLSCAEYRSYRDEASRRWLSRIGFPASRDPVYPDLVFGLPEELLPVRRAPDPSRRVIGLGLMDYAGKYSTAEPRPDTYTAYLEALADFAKWLLEQDCAIRLFLGEGDTHVIDDFRDVLWTRCGVGDDERITEQRSTSVHDVLTEISFSDVVVVTRFHNVLMSMLLTKPVIAVSFHHKCSELMAQMHMSDYCQDIHQIDPGALIHQFQRIEQDRDGVKRVISAGVERARAALEEQDDRLFAGR